MTFALRRRFPRPWLRDLRSAIEDLELRHEASGFDTDPFLGADVELTVWADEEEAKALRRWCADHGDDILQVFGAKRHRFDLPKRRYLMRAGEEKQVSFQDLNDELTGGLVDMTTVDLAGDRLRFEVEEDRLVPKSGWMGKMGRFRATVEIFGVARIDDDAGGLDYLPATYCHYDPAVERFSIGSPSFGALYVYTPATDAKVTLGARPTHVRRWRQWVESPGSHS